ncbi:MAG: serine/threonine protein kinase [Actinobacteria bacterium]|nr:MAG: serine/threonine protein kinase [Actinomycetota bacterium]
MALAGRLQIVPMALDRRIGTELGGYRIIEPLGRGGTSVVYRAEHVRLGRQAALKLLSPGIGEADFSGRFLRESQLAASLDHPSIVPVYDAGETDGLLYIAMACVDGTDLKTLLAEEGRLPVRRALRIVAQVGSALDAAHAKGLVHRDVKPANILVAEDDHAYLSDFGAVKELASGGTTRTGAFVGTLEYSAPEQIEGGAVDARTDVYALACVLYECLAGAPPFHRPTEVAVLNAHLHAEPPKLTQAVPELPEALEQVIEKALSKSPLDRYGSCGELVAAARATAAERRVHRRRLAVSLALLALAAALGAAVALGVRALAFGGGPAAVTVAAPPAKPRLELSGLLLRSKDGRTLNDIAYALITAKQYSRALPFAGKAVKKAPVGTLTHGYANFNLGFVLLKLGRCGESLPFLRRALKTEPSSLRPLIRPRISQAKNCSQREAAAPAQSP